MFVTRAHNCLFTIGASFVQLYRSTESLKLVNEGLQVGESLARWRSNLPGELSLENTIHWHASNVWSLFIRALGFRLECVIYRSIRQRARKLDPIKSDLAHAKLLGSMFELDSIFRRGMVHDVLKYCPPSL